MPNDDQDNKGLILALVLLVIFLVVSLGIYYANR